MEIFEKRGRWCVRGKQGGLRKFKTEQEALEFAGIEPVVEEEYEVSFFGEDEKEPEEK
ncbi:MAG: hypothetical protein NZ811_09045 [Gammaproteobacteria bacterium]|nr:hypothetical protein [Gammaproteobacteria bacterium]